MKENDLDRLLQMLKDAAGKKEWTSIKSLASGLGVSEYQARKALKKLRDTGHQIESKSGKGIRLITATGPDRRGKARSWGKRLGVLAVVFFFVMALAGIIVINNFDYFTQQATAESTTPEYPAAKDVLTPPNAAPDANATLARVAANLESILGAFQEEMHRMNQRLDLVESSIADIKQNKNGASPAKKEKSE